ncbi:DNA-binding Lrp family transcriptional regulator [Actinoplanes campanulatus]|uniref:DNA-binding Lrp family transcriptional regulator n=1 Tax=Actinoplanes campanulatus TaxID=113559 RepID=A0A7W5AK66_9ACTN|nr:Lrp/AsnC family transcriptional regulator [Actinoplanes campanulatus]MBB3097635.1 DNA-binding Lrp family transcriptional regulator [Actinoplanes campanulatus]GGN28003.1 AsnC family transcriptional regulator [Actinoplanes campanulatus]GID37901.1 AsnC family transcriptional regulator [Actinoplanes campanulatus]
MASDTPGKFTLDELDYQLVTALQLAPRADWQRIGAALGVDGTTAARRWNRLYGSGHAWISCLPAQLAIASAVFAIIEVDCVAGRLPEVAESLAGDVNIVTLEHVTGARDLLIQAAFSDHVQLGRYLSLRLGMLPGVASTRTQIAVTVHTEGSRWRLDRLSEPARRALTGASPRQNWSGRPFSDEDLALFQALSTDPRQPAVRLAERTGLSPTTVRRRLDRMDAERSIGYRCEVARYVSGYPISVSLWCTLPPAETPRVVSRLSGMRETRFCATLSGSANLLVVVWLRSVQDIAAFEARLAVQAPELTITDRAVALWVMKLGGHLLDPLGRNLRAVPLGFWSDPVSDAAEGELLARLRQIGVS